MSYPADRGPSPEIDTEALRVRYATSPASREPDTFVLYRIIGNDLPPRHAAGQSRKNLEFILEHEPDLPGCEKRFIVNRIADSDEEHAVLAMLNQAGARYLHLPFDPEEYRAAPWDVEGVPLSYAPCGTVFAALTEAQQGRVLMRLYRYKNNAVMNNNGARNAALREGRTLAKWVLPWDGNCFLTAQAWRAIVSAVAAAPHIPYFMVPMARVTGNARLLDDAFSPESKEEPQIIFRRDAPLEFDPAWCYGRRPKVELLWRLGVPGDWDTWSIEPWDLSCPPYAAEAGAVGRAGWVARLSSGQSHLEQALGEALVADRYDRAFVDRGLARVEAIKTFIDRLDDRIANVSALSAGTVFIPPATVLAERVGGTAIAQRLREAATEALGRGPYSVVHKKSLPPSGNRHDYWHPAPYYWPHPLRLPWFAYVRRDGKRVPGTRLYEPLSERYDRTRLQRLFDDTFVLTLASLAHDEPEFARHAAMLVRVWFLEPETAMNPHLEYAQVRRGHNENKGSNSGIIEMKDLYYFLDAVRLLAGGQWLSGTEQAALQEWFGRYLNWLRTSPQGCRERTERNNHGTYYDLQVATVAAFLGESRIVRETLCDSRFRVLQQFDDAGGQREEMQRTDTAHYCCFNLQGWIHLAHLAARCGEDLWSFQGRGGESVRGAMQWLLAHIGRPWPHPQSQHFDEERFFPIHHAYLAQFGDRAAAGSEDVPMAADIKSQFHPHDGIMPFWQVGLWSGAEGHIGAGGREPLHAAAGDATGTSA